MKILYIGHPAHEWSGSSKFFKDVLKDLGSVSFLAPTFFSVEEDLFSALESEFDLYVFFQFDFLAYAFVAAGKNVLIVPMVDGSGGYKIQHWFLLRNARFIAFSKTLNNYLRMQNLKTFNLKYWPEPETYSLPLTDSIYYWPRKSHFPLTVEKIDSIFSGSKSITVRILTDDPREVDSLGHLPNSVSLKKILDREEHINEIRKSSVFIAPRLSEGIGHSFLEALSYGRPVVAYNFPSMSEYISTEGNGMLIGKHTRTLDPNLDWIQMGRLAHKSVSEGRERYLSTLVELENFVTSSPKCFKAKPIFRIHELLNLSVGIYKQEQNMNGFFNLGQFAKATQRLNLGVRH